VATRSKGRAGQGREEQGGADEKESWSKRRGQMISQALEMRKNQDLLGGRYVIRKKKDRRL